MKVINRYKEPDIKGKYIGRGTVYGNPFVLGEDKNYEEVVSKYRTHVVELLSYLDKEFIKGFIELKCDDVLICSCKPRPCHGDVLVDLYDTIQRAGTFRKGIRDFIKANGLPYTPSNDGVDHINIYSKGATKLGKALTNMSDLGINLKDDGEFATMESYWHWLSTGKMHDEFRRLGGFQAKSFAKGKKKIPYDEFNGHIQTALLNRFNNNPYFKKAFTLSTLPFTHYYHYGGSDDTVLYTRHGWLVDWFEETRTKFKAEWSPLLVAGSRKFTDYSVLVKAIEDSGFTFSEIVSGAEPSGVDALGERYAKEHGLPVALFKADWNGVHRVDWDPSKGTDKTAGFRRNEDMAKYADKAVVIIVNNSPGSKHMVQCMQYCNKPVHVVHITT